MNNEVENGRTRREEVGRRGEEGGGKLNDGPLV